MDTFQIFSHFFSRQIATSKFEPTYARQAFPCFDEPNLKAKYVVHLLKPKDESYIALSNYPVAVSISNVCLSLSPINSMNIY